ncbi:MAG: alpha-L-fucosidase [Prevotella sp.]|nr:alpha-L-fucosidase [Prevotella sp.]
MKRTFLSFLLLLTMISGFSARRVLYIGDSITDGGWGRSGGSAKASKDRNHSDLNHVYGHSYMMLCAAYYQSQWPDCDWQFWNRGISGNTLFQMADRWQEDALSLTPDVISILIGTNDVGAYLDECKKAGKPFTIEEFDYNRWESQYRHLLDTTRMVLPNAELVLCTPFVGKSTGQVRMAITDSLAQIVRKIADDYKATLVPFDNLFADLQKSEPTPKYWIWDGIHPTAAGHQRMAELWESRCHDLMITDNRVTINVTRDQLEQCPEGPYEASWQSISAHYRTPEWFQDAKFGIFIHWGVYSVPAAGSEWYPKHMYNGLAKVHREKWGCQSQFGYKDFIPMFKAEKFNASEWAELFREAGARYVIPTAEHHDGFAMYDSKLTRWNAKQMGPCRDIIDELAEAVRHEGLKFGVSNHRIENWDFMYPLNMPRDSTDLFLPDYSDLYGPPQKPTEQSGMGPKALAAAANGGATEAVINEAAQEGRHPQSDAFLNEWELRVHEIIDRYQPDLLYFDNGINYRSLDPWKLRLARYYYNSAHHWQKEVSIQSKAQAYLAGSIQDFERESRAPRKPYDRYWQVDDPIGNKFGYIEGLKLQSADGIIRNLVDNVACGGNLCLNVSPRSDGTIPDDQQQVLRTIGKWLRQNGEGIYGTRPYKTAIEKNIRFTQAPSLSGKAVEGAVYAFVLRWDGKPFTIKSLDVSKVKSIISLADGKKIRFKNRADGIFVEADGSATNNAVGFKIVMK